MFEGNTTPAQQDTTVSTTEQDIVESVETIIHSSNQTRILDLEAQLASAQASRDYYQKLSTERWDTIIRAREAIENVLSGDINAEQTYSEFAEAFDLLGVENEHEVEFELTITYKGTITLPRGTGIDDLNADDFGLNEPEHSIYYTNVWDTEIDLSER
jgi:hypothetical protein